MRPPSLLSFYEHLEDEHGPMIAGVIHLVGRTRQLSNADQPLTMSWTYHMDRPGQISPCRSVVMMVPPWAPRDCLGSQALITASTEPEAVQQLNHP